MLPSTQFDMYSAENAGLIKFDFLGLKTLTVIDKTQKLIKHNNGLKFKKVIFDRRVSKVSIIGVGMITTPGVTFRMFQALSRKNINILAISTSEIKISVLINRKNIRKAVATLHKEFKLG